MDQLCMIMARYWSS